MVEKFRLNGHSHSPVLKEYNKSTSADTGYRKSLYANTGGWVDGKHIKDDDFTGSWVEIERSVFDGNKTYTIKMYQFDTVNKRPVLKETKSLTVTKDGKVIGDIIFL